MSRLPDATLALKRDGYEFISRRTPRTGVRAFETRILLRPTICLVGADAARLVYDERRFARAGGLPGRVQRTLTGVGGVQGLDDEAHRRRKQMFMTLMTPEGIDELTRRVADRWEQHLRRWETMDEVVLLDESASVLFQAVADWAGVPTSSADLGRRVDDMLAMIDSPALIGPRHWRGRFARRRCELWLASVIDDVRDGTPSVPAGSATDVIAHHRNLDGDPLSARVGAVELLNVLRPTVAINRFIAFAAVAMNGHPEWRERLRDGTDDDVELFVQEVRRYYPFFPMVAATARSEFDWGGLRFRPGQRTLLDLYGTNHDPQLWGDPHRFRPDRFRDWGGDPYTFVPQGGGDHETGHRCAGEWITIAVMKTAVEMLTRSMTAETPPQDLTISLRRVPTQPASGVVLRDVRRADTGVH